MMTMTMMMMIHVDVDVDGHGGGCRGNVFLVAFSPILYVAAS